MGNEQSSTTNANKKEYKLFKITGKDIRDDYIRFHLDDYVNYSNGDYKRIDFEKKSAFTRVQLSNHSVGRHVLIDMKRTRCESSGHSFRVFMDSRVVEMLPVLSDDQIYKIALDTNEYFGMLCSNREDYTAAIEYGNWASKTIQNWTSYNLPPK